MKTLAKLSITATLLFSGNILATEQAAKFFENYTQLLENMDHKIVNLYSQSSKMLVNLKFANGKKRSMTIDGKQWKKQLPGILDQAKSKNDKSLFSDVSVTEISGGFKIKANRYSTLKCFTDTGYYMLLSQKKDGSFEIIEEYIEAEPESTCK